MQGAAVIVDGMATTAKAALRERLLAARRSVTEEIRADEARSLKPKLLKLATSTSPGAIFPPDGKSFGTKATP